MKSHHIRLVRSGSSNEMITKGGEVKFVSRIIENSLKLERKLKWVVQCWEENVRSNSCS